MSKNFWMDLPRGFMVLAPMEEVTDTVFRRVVARAGRPEVFFTEFMNVSGFCHAIGRDVVGRRLVFSDEERPIVAQIWGSRVEEFVRTAREVAGMGFAGVDINMGCPDRAVVRSGGGSGLIENPDLAVAIIQAVKSSFGRRGPVARSTPENLFARSKKFSGVAPPRATPSAKVGSLPVFTGDHSVVLPVSVKTRLGVRDVSEWREWIGVLLGQDLAALTIHLRTRKEMSKVPAHYELIPEILELRDAVAPGTRIIINGDVTGRAMARELAERYPGVDGWMVGRGVFANPFCFESEEGSHTREELVGLLRYHLDLFDEAGAGRKFAPLKRFFKIYINGFAGAGAVRERLMETQNTDEARAVLDEYFSR